MLGRGVGRGERGIGWLGREGVCLSYTCNNQYMTAQWLTRQGSTQELSGFNEVGECCRAAMATVQ